MQTIKQAKQYINSKLPLHIRKRLRLHVETLTYRRKDGISLNIHIPAYINITIDSNFEIIENDITYTLKNKKVCVTIWKDQNVSANITVY